jgi:membrane dipeptidase
VSGRIAALLVALVAAACADQHDGGSASTAAPPGSERARALAHSLIIMDGHVDLPDRMMNRLDDGLPLEDVSRRTEEGDFDHPRAVEGGLDAPFMSIYVPARFQEIGGARRHADQLIDLVERLVRQHPDKFALAASPDEVVDNSRKQLVSLPLGIENGAAIEDQLANLVHFHRRGVRYITLTHGKDNLICDSSYDQRGTWKGLSPFGRQVVAEMNRLGIMVDVSHISDRAFDQAIELSKAPVIASHSSARHFTPGWQRNLDDERIVKLGKQGGVILINFGSSFISQRAREYFDGRRQAIKALSAARIPPPDEEERDALEDGYAVQYPPDFATVEQVADHIFHVIELAGIDHVGLGSDFDGVGDSLPVGLKDVSAYPNLIRVLLERGMSEADLEKVLSGNFMRVWRAVEAHARSGSATRN